MFSPLKKLKVYVQGAEKDSSNSGPVLVKELHAELPLRPS
jgi:hypothetical protein